MVEHGGMRLNYTGSQDGNMILHVCNVLMSCRGLGLYASGGNLQFAVVE